MIGNSESSWGWPAKLLHWIAALGILVLLVHGWWMTHVTPRPDRFANYNWHAALGYDVLALLILRLLWRWTHRVPSLPAGLLRWERIAARTGHTLLYVLMFAASLSGWALAGTFRRPMTGDMFGVQIPQIVSDRGLHDLFEASHTIASYLLGLLLLAHVAGALRHHLVKRNDVLRRMWIGRTTSPP
jgi:cytochrome b561